MAPPTPSTDGVVAITLTQLEQLTRAGGFAGLEVALVLAEVVASAAELEVGEVGGSVLGPVDDVVAVAEACGEGAAGFDTRPVPDPERAAL